MQGALIARIPMRMSEQVAFVAWWIGSAFSARLRANGVVRAEIGLSVVGVPPVRARRARAGRVLEVLIDKRIYFGRSVRGGEAWPDLEIVAGTLMKEIARLKIAAPGRPVIVSPFHYVSQYANIYVIEKLGALLGIESLAVVSGVPRDQYGNDHAMIPGVKVLYTYGDDNRNGLGLRMARSLMRNGVAVLFADVPPFALHRFPMETVDVTILGRSARIHNGVFRMGAPLDAILLPFYLRFERGRFDAQVLNSIPLAAPDAPQRLAHCIESALFDNYHHWLPAGHPSMYAFAPSK